MDYISLIKSIFYSALDLRIYFFDSLKFDVEIDMNFRKSIFDENSDYAQVGFANLMNFIDEKILYIMEDNYMMHYLFLKEERNGSYEYIVVGPYIVNDLIETEIKQICIINSIGTDKFGFLKNFYGTLPVVKDLRVIRAISSLTKHLYKENHQYKLEYLSSVPTELDKDRYKSYKDSIKEAMDMVKYRYDIENELLKNVEKGDFKKSTDAFSKLFSNLPNTEYTLSFEDNKNSLIIANVLLRKTVEKTGVHPYYIDKISRKYAHDIKVCQRVAELDNLVFDMTKNYCKLVRDFCVDSGYSPLIKDAIYHITANYDQNLTLSDVSQSLNINKNYLSTLFKKETGTTITKYILNKKMTEANRLIETTNILISDVANMVGIDDVSYFTKLYKKHYGITPSKYKSSFKENLK